MNACNSKNDVELLHAYVRTGDQAAFAELVSRHGALVYRVCFRTLVNRQDAEDASQAVFMALIKESSKLHGESLANWLFAVSRQTSAFLARSRVRRARREACAAESMEADSRCPTDGHEREAVMRMLDKELASLSALQREAVILRYLRGLSEKAAAAMAGCAPNAISSRANDGISRLRQRLIRRGCALGIPALIGMLAAESQAAVPETLIPSLMAAPKMLAAGAAAGQGAGSIVSIMEGTMKAVFMAKMKVVVVGLLATGLLGAGSVVVVRAELNKGNPVSAQQEAKASGDAAREKVKDAAAATAKSPLAKKLDSIVIDHIEFKNVSLSTVSVYLQVRSKELDTEKKGVNVVVKLDAEQEKNPPVVTMLVDNISLGDAIKYICILTGGLKYQLDDASNTVIISK